MPGDVQGPSYQPGPQKIDPLKISTDHSGAEVINGSPCWLPDGNPRDLVALLHLLRAVRAHPDSLRADEWLGLAIDAVCEHIRECAS
jgi:hypothetical protein